MPGANELTHCFTYLLYIHDFAVHDETTAMAGITFPPRVPWQWWGEHSGRMGISQDQVLTGLLQSMEPVKKRYGHDVRHSKAFNSLCPSDNIISFKSPYLKMRWL